ncbi:hypothetical protein LTR85_011319 [Meristemomyces frigidus]|nr:hypothetical protein LTR85_011319 [Meristemomyces frigidus]
MYLNPRGRNWGPLVNWDDLGKLYAGFITIWTLTLISGIGWLLLNRRVPFIRMRNLPLAIASVAFLHVYLVKICLAYTVNGNFSCSAEFWIMSIYLPFGIALFQANVMQLASVSDEQGKLVARHFRNLDSPRLPERWSLRRFWQRWSDLTGLEKGFVLIGVGMFVQLCITAILYATSPVLQGDWSSYGHIPFRKGQAKCRRSLQWIPSAFWQLFWSWVFGPYMLYRIRHIRDEHHWRLQTTLCVLSGFLGSPLWLAALYSLAFKPVNIRWVPPMWLAPGIVVMQFVTIFFPVYEYFEYNAAVREITPYLDCGKSAPSESSTTLSRQRSGSTPTAALFHELSVTGAPGGRQLYRMTALEKALVLNPAPLLSFAATKDFAAENIIFLLHVKNWRDSWRSAPRCHETGAVTREAQKGMMMVGLELYRSSICERTATFPLQLEALTWKALHDAFEPHLHLLEQRIRSRTGTATTAELEMETGDWRRDLARDLESSARDAPSIWSDKKDTEISVSEVSIRPHSPMTTSSASTPASVEQDEVYLLWDGERKTVTSPAVYPGVDEHVFDAAEASIKLLVLQSTWRKFVKAHEETSD